ncbi:MAG: C4-dicarboxylate ABC transporter [Rhodospirillaceae bacterium]|nr:C4-dicarboxylate ABC transporter [Rhodospirillaceae bacterium]
MVRFLFTVGARRKLEGSLQQVVRFYSALIAVWTIWAATFAIIDPLSHGAIFVCFIFGLMFLVVSSSPDSGGKTVNYSDWMLSILSILCGVYFIVISERVSSRISLFDPLTEFDLLVGTILWLLAIEATRRAVGLGLTLIVIFFVIYNLFGHLLAGVLSHGYISYSHFLDQSIFTTNGLFGMPIRVAATYAFLFVGFGVFLQRAGGGTFFYDLASSVTGKTPGGPAKVSIFSSALYGTMSGSPTSDVVTTGSITIPMMRRLGYSPVMAGAIEVAASTGGSILPPVMGSAVFILVEFTGITYQQIVIAAIIPALLFYFALYVQVHLGAVRLKLKNDSASDIPRLGETIRKHGILLLPLAVIIAALSLGFTPTFSALFGAFSAIVVSMRNTENKIGLLAFYDSLSDISLRIVPVAAACAAAGLVVGGMSLTGLAGKFSYIVFALAGQSNFLTLIVAGLLCILLGMGMPTPSAYILAAVLIADVLIGVNIDVLTVHMFLLFFAVLSAITPPVAVAAYAASSIAEANPLSIAVTGLRLSLVLFIIPFAFVYNPSLLAQGSMSSVIVAFILAVLGVFLLCVASEGYFRRPLKTWERLVAVGLGGCLLFPTIFLENLKL